MVDGKEVEIEAGGAFHGAVRRRKRIGERVLSVRK